MTLPDRIERVRIFLVSRERVWAALTQPEQFSQWFGIPVRMDVRIGGEIRFMFEQYGNPAGVIEEVSPPHRFAYRWHAPQAGADLSLPVTQTYNTLVEFTLEEVAEGTRLTLVQSGFASLPASAIESYLKLNQRGWDGALTQLETYLRSEAQERL